MNEDQNEPNELTPEEIANIGEYECLNPHAAGMDFSKALELVKEGRCVMRLYDLEDAASKDIWFGRFLQLCTDIEATDEAGNTVCDDAQLIVIRNAGGDFSPWSPRLEDVMAEDWCEVLRDKNDAIKSDYKERIANEFSDLNSRLDKLESFIGSDKFKTIDKKNRAMLKLQRFVMAIYGDILEMRLEA